MKFGIQDNSRKYSKPTPQPVGKIVYTEPPESPVKKVSPFWSETKKQWWLSIRVVNKETKENE